MKFATKSIHSGQEADKQTGSVIVPIYQTSTYLQKELGKPQEYEYSRTGNPTRTALENSLASLENGTGGLAFGSGMAAISSIVTLLDPGDHVIVCDDVYGGTYRLFEQILRKYGLSFSYVDATDISNVSKEITDKTKMVWLESPTNPLMKLIDITSISELCSKKEIISVVDSTFTTPYIQTPLDLGATIVVHSTTKYLGGHSDVIGGALVTSDDDIFSKLKFIQNAIGAIPGPFDSWLILRGIKTLSIRMERHSYNAKIISEYLQDNSKVSSVKYPGLPDHPQYDLALKQMNDFGGMISFELKGGLKQAKKFLETVEIFTLAESLGGVESLIEHPAIMTHASIPPKVRLKQGISDNLIRLSVGIEDVNDLIDDLDQAFNSIES